MKNSINLRALRKPASVLSVVLCLMLLLSLAFPATIFADSAKSSDIVILFENDVHCAIGGYSKISAMKNELKSEYENVGVVSVGDFVQGDTIGAISQGEYVINIMNMVGYDAIALGNHEFDYKLQRLYEITSSLDTAPVCSNFYKIGEKAPVFEPYVIKSYGDVDIAYIGVTTPDTLISASPAQFMDENGSYLYTFCGDNLYSTVQSSIDSAKKEGADYIVGLTHLGTEYVYEQWSAQRLIENTTGLDVVLDGHSHSVVENLLVSDKEGNEVVVASTGTKFANIGKLTVSDGEITTELIPTESYTSTDPAIDDYIVQINEEYGALGSREVGESEVDLIIQDEDGNRLIRHAETNLGNFCADAFRIVTGADVGVINGGGIRDAIGKGTVTFNDILSVYPFNNTVCVAEVTGQQLLDFIEYSACMYPVENSSYQHFSGVTYTLNSYIPSPVKFDENMAFESVDGQRRVTDVKILNGETGVYEPIDVNKIYTLASHNYLLVDHGSGATMLNDTKLVLNSGMLDVELLEVYIKEHLGGVIGTEYAESQNRVKIVDEAPATTPVESKPADDKDDTAEDANKDNSDKSPATGDLGYSLAGGFAVLIFAASLWLVLCKKSTKAVK